MITESCAVCGIGGALENHHVIPRSVGGSDDAENMITLCSCCHGKFHGSSGETRWSSDHKSLQAAGIARAKASGKYTGRKTDKVLHTKIRVLRDMGFSYTKIQMQLGCSRATIAKVVTKKVSATVPVKDRKACVDLHTKIKDLRSEGYSYSMVQLYLGCSRATIAKVVKVQ